MAIFVSECAICGGAINERTPYVATSGVAFGPEHMLYEFCDTGLHQRCLVDWEHRQEFATGYAATSGGTLLLETDGWRLYCGPM